MYVVMGSTGSYETYAIFIVGVTDDEVKANASVEKMKALAQRVETKMKNMYQFHSKWVEENPMPQLNLKEVPQWSSHALVSQEQRDKRNMIEQENQDALLDFQYKTKIWQQSCVAAQEAWKKDNMTAEEIQMSQHYDENHYWVEAATVF